MIALNHAFKDVLGAFPDLSRNMKKSPADHRPALF